MKLPKLINFIRWMLLTAGVVDRPPIGIVAQERSPTAPFDFKNRFIVSVLNTDMLPSAYIDITKGKNHDT